MSISKIHTIQEKNCFIGIDLGGTSITIGVIDDDGKSLARIVIPTQPEDDKETLIERLTECIQSVIQEAKISEKMVRRVGLATPGTMDIPNGILICPSNLPRWRDFPIRDALAESCGYPVTYAHDASSAAFGEYWMGAGKYEQGLILLTLGTGIGCGIVLNGHVWTGTHSHGGECGHNLIDITPNARWCNCGQRGHLEAYASATGVIKRTCEMLDAGVTSSLTERVAAAEHRSNIPKIVCEEAKKGDKTALAIVDETAYYLACGLVSLIHTNDPSCILFGGAMTFGGKNHTIGRRFLNKIKKEVYSRIFVYLAERIRIDYAELGSKAGYLGVAGLARQDWYQSLETAQTCLKPTCRPQKSVVSVR